MLPPPTAKELNDPRVFCDCVMSDPISLLESAKEKYEAFVDEMHKLKRSGELARLSDDQVLQLSIWKASMDHDLYSLETIVTNLHN